MYGAISSTTSLLGSFKMADVAMRYSDFVPRAYNLAKSLGFEPGKIMPSIAFCSDESQGYPVILITKHFNAFPFDHGRAGGMVSSDAHGPYAHHGQDLVIIHASHVGYDTSSESFGIYRRLQTTDQENTTSCGKVCGVIDWYLKEYDFAKNNIFLSRKNGEYFITIDNWLLHSEKEHGLILKLDQLIKKNQFGEFQAIKSLSTSKVFVVSDEVISQLKQENWKEGEGKPMGKWLTPDLFYFKHPGSDHMQDNLANAMPHIVTSEWPSMKAAQVNTQVEFDLAFRRMLDVPEYQGKNLLFISGLNVDISPEKGQLFPLTKFIPWAAYRRTADGQQETWEQTELYERLKAMPTDNPDQIDLEKAIQEMGLRKEIKLPF